MGVLRHVHSGRSVLLGTHNVAGRAHGSAVLLTDPSASNDHASVFWTGERWKARDLGSTNGTFVDHVRIQLRQSDTLEGGSILRFGVGLEEWELVDETGPSLLARSLQTGEERSAEDGLLALPDAENVKISISMAAGGRWVAELPEGSRRALSNGEHLVIDGQTWELVVPPASPVIGTYEEVSTPSIATIGLRFHVSRDEEHVRLEAIYGDKVISFGERAGFYLLLILARARRKDAEDPALPDAEHGWYHVDDITKALDVDEQGLNIAVFRLRNVFAKARVEGANGIIERRSRQLRIGMGRLEEIKA